MTTKGPYRRATVEARLIANVDMIDASQACALLRIETDDPRAVIRTMAEDDAIVALIQDGETILPLFQFDVANGSVFDAVRHILMIRPSRITNLRLIYWVTRAHMDFGCAPAQRFGKEDAAILAAFRRYIEPH